MGGAVTAELHIDVDQAMTVRNFTRSHRPFVTLDLGEGTLCLYLTSVDQVDRLAELIAEARMLLVAALGEDPGPIVRPGRNPYLTPGPLPVGVS